ILREGYASKSLYPLYLKIRPRSPRTSLKSAGSRIQPGVFGIPYVTEWINATSTDVNSTIAVAFIGRPQVSQHFFEWVCLSPTRHIRYAVWSMTFTGLIDMMSSNRRKLYSSIGVIIAIVIG